MGIDVPNNDHHHELTEEELFCLEGCRSYQQYYGMRQNFERQVCAFCHPDPELNQIAWEDEWMMVWHVHSRFMRDELALHILIVPKRHVRFMADLAVTEWISLGFATEFAKMRFGYTGGLFHAREGDMRNNAGTVPHLHINIFEPNGTAKVEVPVLKDLVKRAENRARAAEFASCYENGITPDRFKQLVEGDVLDENGQSLTMHG